MFKIKIKKKQPLLPDKEIKKGEKVIYIKDMAFIPIETRLKKYMISTNYEDMEENSRYRYYHYKCKIGSSKVEWIHGGTVARDNIIKYFEINNLEHEIKNI